VAPVAFGGQGLPVGLPFLPIVHRDLIALIGIVNNILLFYVCLDS
jgi:hypothetical protein